MRASKDGQAHNHVRPSYTVYYPLLQGFYHSAIDLGGPEGRAEELGSIWDQNATIVCHFLCKLNQNGTICFNQNGTILDQKLTKMPQYCAIFFEH